MNRQEKINELMKQGLTQSQAIYACDKSRGKDVDEYKPRPRQDKKPEILEKLDLAIIPNPESEYGWDVILHGVKRSIFVTKGTQYKDGSCKYYPAVALTIDHKQRLFSLSSLIWLGYLKRDIPAGYVVDHIDNDSFNNDIRNLQLLTIRENIEKNPSKKQAAKNALKELLVEIENDKRFAAYERYYQKLKEDIQ